MPKILSTNRDPRTRAKLGAGQGERERESKPASFFNIFSMKYTTLIFCAVFLFFGLTTKASAATYYVDPGGNDACNGLSQSLGSSGTCAWLTIKHALTSHILTNGDILQLANGTYVLPSGGNWTVATLNPTDNITIQGASPNTTSMAATRIQKTDTSGVMLFNDTYIGTATFKWLSFTAADSSANVWWGASQKNASINFQNCLFDGNSSSYGWEDFQDNTIAKTVSFTNCEIRNFGGGWFIGRAAGTYAENPSSVTLFSGNFIHDMSSSLVSKTFTPSGSLGQVQIINNDFINASTPILFQPGATPTSANFLIQNNIFVDDGGTGWLVTTNDASIQMLIANPSWVISQGNIVRQIYRDSGGMIQRMIYSGNNNYYIPESPNNFWLNPGFTNYISGNISGSTFTLVSGSLAAKHGVVSVPTTDFAGNPFGANDVGCYANPIKTNVSINSNVVAASGDSITYGVGTGVNSVGGDAITTSTEYTNILNNYLTASGLTVISGSLTGVSGQDVFQNSYQIDKVVSDYGPGTLYLMIGINNIGVTPKYPLNGYVSYTTAQIERNLDKIASYGIRPIWLGITSAYGNPPDNTDIATVNAAVGSYSSSHGWSNGSVLDQMLLNGAWKTTYYNRLTTASDVHPNSAGHALIGSFAEYLYYPHHIVATDKVDIGAGARIYADGKFRDLGTTNSSTATISITPQGGVGLFNVNDKSFWLDVTNITNWTNTHKTWTESNAQTSNMITDHTIGDLNNNTYYTINVTGASASNISGINGTTCVNAVCQSNSSGTLSFEYNGGYSTHTFDLTPADVIPPVTTATPAGGTYGASRNITLSCVDNLSGCNHTYYTTDGTTPTTGSTIYSVTPITISANTTLKFFSTDLAGNPETPKIETYVIDTTYPVTDITSNPTATTNSTSATFAFSANKTGSTFQCKLDTGSYTSCTSPTNYTSLTEGSHTFTVQATDTLGHVEPSPPSYTWVVDTLAPSSVGVPSFGTITSASIVVVKPATVTETGSGLYQWQVRKNSTTELGLNNISTTSITDSALSENTQYTYDVQFSDNANNVSSYGTQASKYTLVDTPTNLSTSSSANSVSLTVDSFPNDTNGQSGYYFSRSQGGNSGWIQTNSWQDTGLSCGTSYTYSVMYRNGDGTETSSISTSQSTGGCSHGGGRLIQPVPSSPPSVGATPKDGQGVPATSGGGGSYHFGFLTLKLGSRGEAVKELQRFLNAKLNLVLMVDGIFGLKTKGAVIKWQKANGLVPDGLVGKLTKAKMNASTSSR